MLQSSSKKKVLVVDDEPNIRESLKLILGRHFQIELAEDGNNAIDLLQTLASKSAREDFPELVILDVLMPGIDGLGVLENIRSNYPSLPVIMLTASNAVKTAVKAMKIGAVDYLNKPYDVDELVTLVEKTLEGRLPSISPRSDRVYSEGDFGCLVGSHPTMKDLYQKIEQLSLRETTILITGESGTGKELVAREIHQRSSRANKPFVALNCAAIPETLIESELFGHEKGAYTHAHEKRIGHFELADGGTLFLDEIGELSLPVQVKMLRFLQDQEFYRVGDSSPISVNVRILAATNKSLETAIKEGRFRQDLFYRINVVTLALPALRERREDIPNLVDHFLASLSQSYGRGDSCFTEAARDMLTRYSWPGNVRELENVVESCLALCHKDEIDTDDLPARLKQSQSGDETKDAVLNGAMPFEEAERAFETELITKALERSNYVQTKAAELLGISRRILKYKMDKLGISDKPPAQC